MLSLSICHKVILILINDLINTIRGTHGGGLGFRESRLPAASKIGFLAAQATVWVWDRMFPGEKTCRTCTQQAWTSNKQTPEGARESRGAAGVGLKRWSRQGKSKIYTLYSKLFSSLVLRYTKLGTNGMGIATLV